MARESGGSFELPAEMRAFAEKSVEQAKQACESVGIVLIRASSDERYRALLAQYSKP